MKDTVYFTSASFRFLRDLAANNNRQWFAAHKPKFEELVRQPYLNLIADLATPLIKISPHFRADPRPHGGSLSRIQRDTRFAHDKSPYKTYIGARFFHSQFRTVTAPSFYLHIQPGDCFVAAGLWHPDTSTAQRIRNFLVDNPSSWKKAVYAKYFQQHYEIGGDSLVRLPRGYDPTHELATDLKRKDFVALQSFDDKQACAPNLRAFVINACKGLAPMMDYLCAALDLEF